MKAKKFGPFLSAVAVSFCLGFGAVGCLATGFQLEVASMVAVAAVCLVLALLAAFLSKENVGFFVLLGLGGMVALVAMLYDVQPVRKLLYSITLIYDLGYGWGVLFPEANNGGATVDMALCILGGVTVLFAAWTVRQGKSPIWALAPALLTVSLCIVVTDTVPREGYLFLVLAGIVLLLLPQSVRRRSQEEGARLTAILLVPCLLFSAALFWAVPRAGYEQKGNPVQQAVLEWLQSLPFAPKQSVGMLSGLTVDLGDIGPREEKNTKVMEVVGARDGLLYLRGQAYDVYNGTQWGVADLDVVDNGWPTVDGGRIGTVKIRTMQVLPIRYVPYYIYKQRLTEDMVQGKFENPDGRESYSFIQMDAVPTEGQNITLDTTLKKQCLSLPAETRKAAEAILEKIMGVEKLSVAQMAERIGDYVRASATYDLNTPAMPKGAEDFALWFLENGETGYCVHFASAATVLLRAVGLPARYVTGYVVSALDGQTVIVDQTNSHAWVEYYMPGEGWKVMEATPAEGLPQAPVVPDPTDPTIPTETIPPTTAEPTEPTEGTQPTTGVDPTTKPTTRPGQEETEATTPGTTPGGNVVPGSKVDRTWILRILKVLAYLGGGVLVVWGQYILRRQRKRRKMDSGPMNRRALARWKQVRLYARLLKLPIPKELEELAEKARFSQHTLTAEELGVLGDWLKQAGERLSKRKDGFLLRLILALG